MHDTTTHDCPEAVKSDGASSGTARCRAGMRKLVDQPFRLHCGSDRRTRGHSLLESLQVCKLRQIQLDCPSPGRHGEKIRIGDREPVPEEVLTALQLSIDQGIALQQILLPLGAGLSGCVWLEEGAVGLVDLRMDVTEHLLQAVARHRTGGRRKSCLWLEVSEVLNDRRPFGEDLS